MGELRAGTRDAIQEGIDLFTVKNTGYLNNIYRSSLLHHHYTLFGGGHFIMVEAAGDESRRW